MSVSEPNICDENRLGIYIHMFMFHDCGNLRTKRLKHRNQCDSDCCATESTQYVAALLGKPEQGVEILIISAFLVQC